MPRVIPLLNSLAFQRLFSRRTLGLTLFSIQNALEVEILRQHRGRVLSLVIYTGMCMYTEPINVPLVVWLYDSKYRQSAEM